MTKGRWCIFIPAFSRFGWDNSKATVLNGFPGNPSEIKLCLLTVIICLGIHTLHCLPSIPCLTSPRCYCVFWNHFQNKLLALESLTQDLLLIEHKIRKYIPKVQAAEKHSVFMLFSNRTDFRTGRSMETKKIGLAIFVDINYLCFL